MAHETVYHIAGGSEDVILPTFAAERLLHRHYEGLSVWIVMSVQWTSNVGTIHRTAFDGPEDKEPRFLSERHFM